MALINCPECGKAFSDKAATCPNCAYPLTNMDRIRLGIIDSKIALHQAEEMYREKKFSKAYEIYFALSQNNNPNALLMVGTMLIAGEGAEKNVKSGLDYLNESADMGNSEARLALARYYEDVDKDCSLQNYKVCTQMIDTFDDKLKAVIYKKCGILLDNSNFEEKSEYLETALNMGLDTKKELGSLYLEKGIDLFNANSLNESEEYLLKAKKLGVIEADSYLGKCYYNISKTSEEKLEFLNKAALYKNQDAIKELGEAYLKMYVDTSEREYLEKASELGNPEAMEKYSAILNKEGTALFSDEGEIPEIDEAVKLFKKSNDLGNQDARKNLAVLYNKFGVDFYNGENGREVDFLKAEKCFKQAESLGSASAKTNLGIIYNQYGLKYRDGKGGKINLNLSEEYFLKAISCGNERAKHNLMIGYINAYFNYKHGVNGFIREPAKANEILQKARDFDQDMLDEIAKDYYTRAKAIIVEGVNHNNYKKVNSYLKRASRLGVGDLSGDLIAFYKLISSYYKKGKNGFTKSQTKANNYMRKAAELGDEEALKKYKPSKKKGKSIFEKITGFNPTSLKKSTKGYGYKYKDYEEYKN